MGRIEISAMNLLVLCFLALATWTCASQPASEATGASLDDSTPVKELKATSSAKHSTRSLYDQLDTNGDGAITREEFEALDDRVLSSHPKGGPEDRKLAPAELRESGRIDHQTQHKENKNKKWVYQWQCDRQKAKKIKDVQWDVASKWKKYTEEVKDNCEESTRKQVHGWMEVDRHNKQMAREACWGKSCWQTANRNMCRCNRNERQKSKTGRREDDWCYLTIGKRGSCMYYQVHNNKHSKWSSNYKKPTLRVYKAVSWSWSRLKCHNVLTTTHHSPAHRTSDGMHPICPQVKEVEKCECDSKGRIANKDKGDWCTLKTRPCMRLDNVKINWSWIRCTVKGVKQVPCKVKEVEKCECDSKGRIANKDKGDWCTLKTRPCMRLDNVKINW